MALGSELDCYGANYRDFPTAGSCQFSAASLVGPKQRTRQPTYTTSSVLGLCYDGGVVLAADMGVSGGCLRFNGRPRLTRINEFTMIGLSGDYADCQYLESVIDAKIIEEERHNEAFKMKPRSLHVYLSRILYQRRNKFEPLWTNIIVAGMQDNKPFLGAVDMVGTAFETHVYSTGLGNYMGMGLMREATDKADGKLTKEAAIAAIQESLRVLYYRDKGAYSEYQIGDCTAEGANIEGPFKIDSGWEIAKFVHFP